MPRTYTSPGSKKIISEKPLAKNYEGGVKNKLYRREHARWQYQEKHPECRLPKEYHKLHPIINIKTREDVHNKLVVLKENNEFAKTPKNFVGFTHQMIYDTPIDKLEHLFTDFIRGKRWIAKNPLGLTNTLLRDTDIKEQWNQRLRMTTLFNVADRREQKHQRTRTKQGIR